MNILNTNSSRQEHLYSWLKLLLNVVIACAYDEDVGGAWVWSSCLTTNHSIKEYLHIEVDKDSYIRIQDKDRYTHIWRCFTLPAEAGLVL